MLDLTRSSVLVPVPGPDLLVHARHTVQVVDQAPVAELLAGIGLLVTTMGRAPDADPLFFEAAGAAGHLAASIL